MKRFLTVLLVLTVLVGFGGVDNSHATIANLTSHIEYTGTNSQTIFPYSFKIYASSDLKVYVKESGAYTLKTLNIDYTVTGVGATGGGNVILTTAPTTAQQVIIYRNPPLLQSQQYAHGGPFPARSAEDSIDKIVMELQGLSARAVKSPMGLLDIDLPLPAPSTNGLFLKWNATGTALEAVTQAPTYAAGCPVEMINAKDYGDGTVSFATLQAAKAAIGSDNRRLYLARGDWPVTSNFTLGSNITVVMEQGGKFTIPNGVTLTIQGPIEAGPYQIFSWTNTGAVNVSASPTADIPAMWFGDQIGTSYDNYAVLTMMNNSLGRHQQIVIPMGVTRITSPQIFSVDGENGFGIKGSSSFGCYIYIDLPGGTGDGVTFQSKTGTDCFGFRVKDLSFIGPANCCTNGVVLRRSHLMKFENVNFYMGASAYAFKPYGSIYCEADFINIGQGGDVYDALGCKRPANGIGFMVHADGYGNNVWNIQHLVISGMGQVGSTNVYNGDGVFINNAQSISITGSLEACGYPVRIMADTAAYQQAQDVLISTQYAYDLNTNGFWIEGGNRVTIDNCGLQVFGGGTGGTGTTIKNSTSTHIRNSRFDTLTVKADCQDTHLNGVGVSNTNGFIDLASDTVYEGPVYSLSSPFNPFPSPGHDGRNLISTGFARWPASGPPDGWAEGDGTWTKETSVVHASGISAKVNTNGHTLYPAYPLTTDELNQVKGQYVNLSIWIKVPAGTFSTYPAAYIFPTVPDRADSTAYSIGDCVQPLVHNGKMYKVIAGTGDFKTGAAPPTFPTTDYLTVTDSHVTLMCLSLGNSSYSTTPIIAADAGTWKQLSTGHYIPTNATGCQVAVYLYRTTAPADVDYYLAEPCLMKGGLGPKGVVPGYGEFDSFIKIGDKKLWANTPTSGVWIATGDVDLELGKRCTIPGAMGTATWSNFP